MRAGMALILPGQRAHPLCADDWDTPARPADDRRTRMLHAALDAAARGWHVFPLRPGTKRPAKPDHDAKQCDGTDPRCRDGHTGWEPRATIDPARIRRGWATVPFNIGIACGPARLVVVDLDTPKPGDTPPPEWDMPGITCGAAVLAVLVRRAGQPYPAGTWTVRTPSGERTCTSPRPAAGRNFATRGGRAAGWGG